jgi:hypothetical protein
MATYNGNNVYIAIDSTDVGAYWKQVEITSSIDEVDVTAGSNAEFRERLGGLRDYAYSITLVYDDTNLASYIQKIRPGIHTLEIGPEGNTAGKPRMVQSVLITEVPFEVTVEKSEVAFSISAVGAAAPTTDMFAGGVY